MSKMSNVDGNGYVKGEIVPVELEVGIPEVNHRWKAAVDRSKASGKDSNIYKKCMCD